MATDPVDKWGRLHGHSLTMVLADREPDGLAHSAKHLDQSINRELGGLLIHHIGYPRARDHEYLGGLGLLQMMFGNPRGEFVHQLLFQFLGIVDVLTGSRLWPPGYLGAITHGRTPPWLLGVQVVFPLFS